ncbi:MAG: DNA adenine methylase [Bacteroidales bacterium]|jgi:DNA adenine methylase|nr:DNA adenine methylase [Tissierellia bacterium]
MERNNVIIKYPSPLRYPGGKSSIFSFVSNIFYENNLIGVSYAEPYAGGAGLALRLLFDEYVNNIYINDYDKSIYAFWLTVINDTDRFCDWISDVEVTLDNWRYFKEIQIKATESNVYDLAKSTFFLNRTNISGVIKGGVIGGIEQKGNYKIDARFNKDDLIARIQKIARFKHRIRVSNQDGIAFINKLNKKKDDIFIYLDPPYFQKGADLYMNFYTKKDHQKLSKYVKLLNKRWMASYDNHDFILSLYSEKRKIMYKLSQGASNRIGDEVLIFSESIDFANSMERLTSPILI